MKLLNTTPTRSVFSRIFDGDPKSPIESITLLPTELQGPHLTSKGSRLDLLVRLHDGTLIDIEVQSSREAHFVRRSLYYTFQMMGGTLGKGGSYENLPSIAGYLRG